MLRKVECQTENLLNQGIICIYRRYILNMKCDCYCTWDKDWFKSFLVLKGARVMIFMAREK